MYVEGFEMEGVIRNPNATGAAPPAGAAEGRVHKIETLVPVRQIAGTANWLSDGFMDGVQLPVGAVK